ncbi:hypothetical protein BHM03_00057640, partial [Ensete ventricosum]
MKDLESTRAELPGRAIDDYKGSADFKEGLKRMGRVAYEYGYRVALAHFRALHPDSEVKEDPFTIRPEDDLVPMERQQAFDDSDSPEYKTELMEGLGIFAIPGPMGGRKPGKGIGLRILISGYFGDNAPSKLIRQLTNFSQ